MRYIHSQKGATKTIEDHFTESKASLNMVMEDFYISLKSNMSYWLPSLGDSFFLGGAPPRVTRVVLQHIAAMTLSAARGQTLSGAVFPRLSHSSSSQYLHHNL